MCLCVTIGLAAATTSEGLSNRVGAHDRYLETVEVQAR